MGTCPISPEYPPNKFSISMKIATFPHRGSHRAAPLWRRIRLTVVSMLVCVQSRSLLSSKSRTASDAILSSRPSSDRQAMRGCGLPLLVGHPLMVEFG